MKNIEKQVLEEGKEVLNVLYEGDCPESAGWLGISLYKDKYYVLTDFEETYGPFESFEKALACEIFEHIRVSFELSSATLSNMKLNHIKLIMQLRSNPNN